jgi:hypothetical protein
MCYSRKYYINPPRHRPQKKNHILLFNLYLSIVLCDKWYDRFYSLQSWIAHNFFLSITTARND